MKKIGNEIPWYKPFELKKRNKDLEKITEQQFKTIFELTEKLKERDNFVEKLTNSNIKLLNSKNNSNTDNILLQTEILRTTLLDIKDLCKKSKTKLAKEILEQIKID